MIKHEKCKFYLPLKCFGAMWECSGWVIKVEIKSLGMQRHYRADILFIKLFRTEQWETTGGQLKKIARRTIGAKS